MWGEINYAGGDQLSWVLQVTASAEVCDIPTPKSHSGTMGFVRCQG